MIRRMVSREGWYADVPEKEWMDDPELVRKEDSTAGEDRVQMGDGVVLRHEADGALLVSCGGLLARVPHGTDPRCIVWRRRGRHA